MKRPALSPLFPLLPLLLVGCGGSQGGSPEVVGVHAGYALSPETATVAPGGTVALQASTLGGDVSALDASVREGEAGGSVRARDADTPGDFTYTAPAAPGTYHVQVAFLSGRTVRATRTATVTVQP